jgi:hypothetical protein
MSTLHEYAAFHVVCSCCLHMFMLYIMSYHIIPVLQDRDDMIAMAASLGSPVTIVLSWRPSPNSPFLAVLS